MEEFVLYGGKGGVGKTSCAAATGLALARRGERVLVVSTDPAHSLGDVLEAELGGEPTEVEPGLWAVEPRAEAGQALYREVVSALAAELRSAGVRVDEDDVERLFTAGLLPGSDELAALQYLWEHADADTATTSDGDDGGAAGGWDRVVFDTAPTGHTLRLLTLPDVLAESLATAGSLRRELRDLVTSARSFVIGPAAYLGRGRTDEFEQLRERLETVATLLGDPDRTEFRVVLLPERLAIAESRRLVERLREFRVPVGALVANRVLPEAEADCCERCRTRSHRQAAALAGVRETFPDLPLVVLPDLQDGTVGRDALARLAGELGVE
jgi:arsenite-transporting ATPase